MSFQQIKASAESEQMALVRDGNIFYIVLNTKLNLINYEFIAKFN